MKLTKLALSVLKGNRELKGRLATALNVTEGTIYYWIRVNSQNLTRVIVIETLQRETGLSYDQIVEHESTPVC